MGNEPKRVGELLWEGFLAKLDPEGQGKRTATKRLGKSRADGQVLTRQETKLVEAGATIATVPPRP